MTERRSLTEGLKSFSGADPELEARFVYGKKDEVKEVPREKPARREPAAGPVQAAAENPATATRPAAIINRVPFTTRLRADIANALKRASLERQLEGVEPNTVQEMLESALDPWLRANGYLP